MVRALLENSRWLYTALVGLVALGRGLELLIARRNYRRLLRRGGVEVGAEHYPWMVLLHVAFLVACPLEVWLLERPLVLWLAVLMTAVMALSMALRYWVVATLGHHWTTRVVCLPGGSRVVGGPYRWLRHPNYLAVAVEILALPLIHSAWLAAAFFSLSNGAILRVRMRVEEAALRRYGSGSRRTS